jgi:hypothetical protein
MAGASRPVIPQVVRRICFAIQATMDICRRQALWQDEYRHGAGRSGTPVRTVETTDYPPATVACASKLGSRKSVSATFGSTGWEKKYP